jgi:hypothetical protein
MPVDFAAPIGVLLQIPFYLRLVVQHRIQQRIVDLDFSVVADESELAELVHEEADAGPGGPDHLRQSFLADIRTDRLRTSFLAEICQQKQQSGQPLLAGIEQLIDQILFNPAVPGQQIRHEYFGKFRLVVKGGEHRRLGNYRDQAFLHRRRRRDAERMAIQAALAKKLPGFEDPDNRFLALCGNDDDLQPAFLNVENRICHVALGEDDLVLAKLNDGFPFAYLGEKITGIERALIGHECCFG